MKMNKFFMLGLAGLAFAACSNEEEAINNGPQFNGNGAVSISFSSLGTKSLENPTTGSGSIQVSGDITVKLYYKDSKGASQTQSITLKDSEIQSDTKYTFWNIASPDSVTASVNGGSNDYRSVDITTLQKVPTEIPAFGSTQTFTLTSDTGTPNLDNQNDPETGEGTETGATNDDKDKVYQLYNATVNMVIPVARLEVSGITHKAHGDDETCDYKTLTIKGVYMDSLYTTGGRLHTGSTAFTAGSNIQDYCWKADQTPSLGTGIDAILFDEITDLNRSFLDSNVKWPKAVEEQNKAFAYNFYAGAENPIFKIYFDTSESNDVTKPLPAPRYAMITNYKKLKDGSTTEYEPVTFQNGKIYRITKAELVDGNILGDEGGNTLYGVEVTVQEASWSVVDIEADWAQ